MARVTYIHRDDTLKMLAAMPARRPGESDASFERRKSKAASRLEARHGLRPYASEGIRARYYREDEVKELAGETVHQLQRA